MSLCENEKRSIGQLKDDFISIPVLNLVGSLCIAYSWETLGRNHMRPATLSSPSCTTDYSDVTLGWSSRYHRQRGHTLSYFFWSSRTTGGLLRLGTFVADFSRLCLRAEENLVKSIYKSLPNSSPPLEKGREIARKEGLRNLRSAILRPFRSSPFYSHQGERSMSDHSSNDNCHNQQSC